MREPPLSGWQIRVLAGALAETQPMEGGYRQMAADAKFPINLGDGDLQFTYLPWRNRRIETPVHDERGIWQRFDISWTKVMCLYGSITQYAYGTETTLKTPGVKVAYRDGYDL